MLVNCQRSLALRSYPREYDPGIQYEKEQAGKKESKVNKQFEVPCPEFLVVKFLVGRDWIVTDIFKELSCGILQIEFLFLAYQHRYIGELFY
jgi:hypothetical protein